MPAAPHRLFMLPPFSPICALADCDVQAVQFVEVKPKVEGFVEDVLVDEGEHVKKGQVLFKLSSAELYEEVKEAQANYKQVQAELKMAEVEADRVKRLVEKDIISPIRLEQALAEADVARLRVQQAKSRLLRAETNYSYTTITSPFEGYVDRIHVSKILNLECRTLRDQYHVFHFCQHTDFTRNTMSQQAVRIGKTRTKSNGTRTTFKITFYGFDRSFVRIGCLIRQDQLQVVILRLFHSAQLRTFIFRILLTCILLMKKAK